MKIQKSDYFCCSETLPMKMVIFPTRKTVDSNRKYYFLNVIFYLVVLDFHVLLWYANF